MGASARSTPEERKALNEVAFRRTNEHEDIEIDRVAERTDRFPITEKLGRAVEQDHRS